ncbi:MAG: hypothetical protein PHW04_04310 [Candidatus Wallbacteria bacterium]|nr:hypothetical protein [Candidatus Wallbacteria bacterium]
MCRKCIYYERLDEQYGHCNCEKAGGFKPIVEAASVCEFYKARDDKDDGKK